MPVSNSCALDGDGCAPLPDAFVRLRFFMGKRMGVVDFDDLQRYAAGKVRFHNLRLHGSGIVAGLGLEQPDVNQPILRVRKGAALDGCGREIIVGYDQCIDVDDWLQKQVAARLKTDPNSKWPLTALVGGVLPLYVGLRYRECAGSPEPAPRDPCGCDDGGCDFGRVRESFELELLTDGEAKDSLVVPRYPDAAAFDSAVRGANGETALERAMARAVTTSAPSAGEEWIILGRITITVDATSGAYQSFAIDADFVPAVLLETSTLQDLLLRGLGALVEPAAFAGGGPAILRPALEALVPTGATYRITLPLAGEIVSGTLALDGSQFALLEFDPATGWSAKGPKAMTAAWDGPTKSIRLDVTNDDGSGGKFLVAGGFYRLTYVGDRARPIADKSMRPIEPLHFAWDFGAVVAPATGTLIAAPPPYAS